MKDGRASTPHDDRSRLSAAARAETFVAASSLVALAVWGAPGLARAESLSEKLLEDKYHRGDYALFAAWHDPTGVQFDEHASFAIPIGLKVRLRLLRWFRAEGEVSYYRRSRGPDIAISSVSTPSFDGLNVSAAAQAMFPRLGRAHTYAGAGIAFVSLSNDFLAVIPSPSTDTVIIDQVQIATWSEFDVGLEVMAGLDVELGHRAFPFLEFRYFLGKLTIDTMRIGSFAYAPSALEKPSENLAVPSRIPFEGQYDWSGPSIAAGLKIRF
jgi:opacity protein-like surface antigen